MTRLDGTHIAMVTATPELGNALARGLSAAGARIVTIGPGASTDSGHVECTMDDRSEVGGAFAEAVRQLGRLDGLVLAGGIPGAVLRSLGDLTADEWKEQANAPVRTALFCLQATHRYLAATKGHVVMVLPTLAISGAPNLVAASTALEGQRILGKVAARQWGRDGITVNTLLVRPRDCLPELDEAGARETIARVSFMGSGDVGGSVLIERDADVTADLVALVSSLLIASPLLTGSTLVADGGIWMVP